MALVALMVLVGGLTRLTESGLSIVKWKLVTGTLPPMSADAWQEEFREYQTSPQFQKVNRGFSLADFKQIYWLEYAHRLLGRLVGLTIFVPWGYFLIRLRTTGGATSVPLPTGEVEIPCRAISPHANVREGISGEGGYTHKPSPDAPKNASTSPMGRGFPVAPFALHRFILRRGFAMAVLVALQGTVGWIMVASGLHDEPRVAPLKLALHLSLALALFLLMLWTDWQLRDAGSVVPPPIGGRLEPAPDVIRGGGLIQTPHSMAAPLPASPRWGDGLQRAARILFALIFLQVIFGALVAGLRAGLSYNTYPLMDGKLIPSGLWTLEPWWRNHLESVLTVQFQHRTLAVCVAMGVLGFAGMSWKHPPHRGALKLALAAIFLQFSLGVATLLSGVHIALASAHQFGALLLLSAGLRLVYIHRAA